MSETLLGERLRLAAATARQQSLRKKHGIVFCYHHTIGIPDWVERPRAGMPLCYSHHAMDMWTERTQYSASLLPFELPDNVMVIEASLDAKPSIVSWLLRFPFEHDPTQHIVMAVGPNGVVRTMWLNLADDMHRSQDMRNYTRVKNRTPR